MKYQNNILKYILIISFSFYSLNLRAQDYLHLYDNVVSNSSGNNSFNSIVNLSKRGNSLDFIILGLNINNRNLLYEKFGKVKYLKENREIIYNIISSARLNNSDELVWYSKTKTDAKFSEEVQLYEGYLVRYIAEFCYIGSKKKYGYSTEFNLTRDIFFKWYNRSIDKFGDNTSLLTSRLHMGSHWAITAQYLLKLDTDIENKRKYKSLINDYNLLLKKNMKINDNNSYIWNSTYDNRFGKMSKITTSYVQDVAHGNHVVLYIQTSYELQDQHWKLEDLKKLIQTLKNTYNNKSNIFYDQLDKKAVELNDISGTAHRQSDGWMKLIKYDKSLYELYKRFYNKNCSIIDKSIYSTQFYVQMIVNQ